MLLADGAATVISGRAPEARGTATVSATVPPVDIMSSMTRHGRPATSPATRITLALEQLPRRLCSTAITQDREAAQERASADLSTRSVPDGFGQSGVAEPGETRELAAHGLRELRTAASPLSAAAAAPGLP